MVARLLRLALVVAAAGAAAWLGRWALTRWMDGPAKQLSTAPWPPAPWPPASDPAPDAPAPDGQTADLPTAELATELATDGVGWVEPVEGGCPATHVVKAKISSHVYHLPGMSAYDRTGPDRCYISAEAAEADGFRRAKR